MTIPPEEAERALREAQGAADRSVTAAGYQQISGHLFVWGAVWIVVNLAGFFHLPHGDVAWPALMGLGVVGSILIALRVRRLGARRSLVWRTAVVTASVLLFFIGVEVISPVNSLVQGDAVVCLGIGTAYVMLGAVRGWRLSAIGLALICATLAVWVYARDQSFLWMAASGGGGLIVGGLWLRKA